MSERVVPPLLGAVLVGGQSTRLGRPKWSEPVGGIPMALRAAAALAPHVHEVVAVAPAGASIDLALAVIRDAPGGGGPLAGLVAALERAEGAGHAGCLVLACDLPLVDDALVGTLVSCWRGEEVVAPESGGRLQPLCALWSASALPAARAALGQGNRSVVALAERLVLRAVPEPEWRARSGGPEPLLNVNTAAELARAARLVQHPGDVGGRKG